jgi:hypothetical protein
LWPFSWLAEHAGSTKPNQIAGFAASGVNAGAGVGSFRHQHPHKRSRLRFAPDRELWGPPLVASERRPGQFRNGQSGRRCLQRVRVLLYISIGAVKTHTGWIRKTRTLCRGEATTPDTSRSCRHPIPRAQPRDVFAGSTRRLFLRPLGAFDPWSSSAGSARPEMISSSHRIDTTASDAIAAFALGSLVSSRRPVGYQARNQHRRTRCARVPPTPVGSDRGAGSPCPPKGFGFVDLLWENLRRNAGTSGAKVASRFHRIPLARSNFGPWRGQARGWSNPAQRVA